MIANYNNITIKINYEKCLFYSLINGISFYGCEIRCSVKMLSTIWSNKATNVIELVKKNDGFIGSKQSVQTQ